MKVLWFTNTPANSDEYFNKELRSTGGWLKSLDKALQEKVDLHVAFYHNTETKPFKYKETTYYPIHSKVSRLKKILFRIIHKPVINKDIDTYLKIVKKVQPDIIHIHGTESSFGLIVNKVNIPVVISIQGNITVYNHKFLSGITQKYINTIPNDIISKLLFQRPFKIAYKSFVVRTVIEKKILKNSQYIIGRTDWDRRITSVLAPKSIYFHNDEILRDSFYTNKWSNPTNNEFIIFSISGNTYYKGFETICHIAILLKEAGFNNFKIEIAGINENDLIVKVVKKIFKDKYPKDKIKLLGRLNEKEIIHKMQNADLYIMASHIENSPNNLCEAMIMGMPCIASYAGGTGSLLQDKKEGILIQDGDPWALSGAIKEICNNKDLAVKYGQNARLRAMKRHDKNKIINDLLEIYQNILNF